jgi:G-patch domain
MDSPQRKVLHEIGNFLRLKSKSKGSKKQRFTTLYKTSISVIDPTDIERIFTGIRARGFMWRMSVKGNEKNPKAAKFSEGRTPRRGGGSDTTRYRDGEIVGAAAPELGTENKGRQMLEKMGWSSGTALGALNNKGILQPVATVIKTSKAGLG